MKPLRPMSNRARLEGYASFKQCPVCRHAWETRVSFLNDSGLELIGYQVSFQDLTAGLFLFNHACRGTLAVPALDFRDLYRGPVFRERATGGVDCPGHCLHSDDLNPCPTHCECAYVREIIRMIRNWPKIVVSPRRGEKE
jgi:hypothetical protein